MENKHCSNNQLTLNKEAANISINVQKSINNILNKLDYFEYSLDIKKISTNGNNFLGDLYEINIEGKTNTEDKNTNIFIKHIIYNDDFRIYSIPEVYAKEAFVYNELGRIFNEMQKNVEIPDIDKFKLVKSYEETNNEAIILQNINKLGFKTMPRMEVMSKDFAELSIKELAKFHGLSFVLEKLNPEFFDKKVKSIKQSFIYDEYWNEIVKKMCDISTRKLHQERKERVDKFFVISLEKYPKYMNGLHSKVKCLCHGDYKMNNILFKEINGKISQVIAIDYQQIYYGCPAIDLIYFIYAASDRSFRKQHLNYLKDVYFGSLTRFLNYFSIDVATICPREEFESCFSNSLEYALMYTLYMLPLLYVSEEVPDLSKDELLDVDIRVDEKFYSIMEEIVEDFVELGVI